MCSEVICISNISLVCRPFKSRQRDLAGTTYCLDIRGAISRDKLLADPPERHPQPLDHVRHPNNFCGAAAGIIDKLLPIGKAAARTIAFLRSGDQPPEE